MKRKRVDEQKKCVDEQKRANKLKGARKGVGLLIELKNGLKSTYPNPLVTLGVTPLSVF